MSGKHPKAETAADTTKVQDVTISKPVQISVPSRSIINSSPGKEDSASEKPTATSPSRSKRIVISPITPDDKEQSAQPAKKDTSTDSPAHKEPASEHPAPPTAMTAADPPSTLAEVKLPEDSEASEASPEDQAKGPGEPSPETLKAVEAAAKRERELQEYIDTHQFFVPINADERKRSIKVSFGLTFLLFILGVLLIDLMLDSGIIELIQKIPHTHFFSS